MQGCVEQIPNGNTMVNFQYYICDSCNNEIPENAPHYRKDNFHLCFCCSYIGGYITEKEYCRYAGIGLDNAHASIIKGKIILWVGNKPPWEYSDKDYRNTTQYREWRQKVFERDDYTCQRCTVRGGELEAHHIKPFNKYKKLRFIVSNGTTYCKKCHKQEHKSMCKSGRVAIGRL